MLVATADRFAGFVGTEKVLLANEDYTNGRESRLMEGVYHEDGDNSDNSNNLLETATEKWYDVGKKTVKEWEQALSQNLMEAKQNKISSERLSKLEALI